jgi:hypothetical protein
MAHRALKAQLPHIRRISRLRRTLPHIRRIGRLRRTLPPAVQRSHPARRPLAPFLCGMFAFIDLYCTQPLLPLLSRVFHASEAR